MTCTNCGKELSGTAKFCRGCGKPAPIPPASRVAKEAAVVDAGRNTDQEETVLMASPVEKPQAPVPIAQPSPPKPPIVPPSGPPPSGQPPRFSAAMMPPAGPPPGRPASFNPPPPGPPPVSKSHAVAATRVEHASRSALAAVLLLLVAGGAYFVFRQFTSPSSADDDQHGVFVSMTVTNEQVDFKVVNETGGTVYESKASTKSEPKGPDVWTPDDPEAATWGIVIVNANGDRMVIDRNGRKFVSPEALPIDQFSEGFAAAKSGRPSANAKCGYADRNFRMAIAAQYDRCARFSEGFAAVSIGGRTGYVDSSGKLQIPARLSGACPFSEGLAKVQQDNKRVFIDKKGNVLFDADTPQCEDSFTEGRVPLLKDKLWGYADRSGKFVIPPIYQGAASFHDGRARVWINNRLGLIDLQGKEIPLPPTLDGFNDFEHGLARIRIGGKWGLLDVAGHTVVQPQYDEIAPLASGMHLATVSNPRRIDFLDATGHLVKAPMPDCVSYRSGVFTCVDVSKTQQPDPLAMLLTSKGLGVVYVTRSGARIGGVSVDLVK